MAEDRPTDSAPVAEHRGGGRGVVIGLTMLVVVIVAAFVLFSRNRSDPAPVAPAVADASPR